MKNYNVVLDNLLKKYGLYEEFNINNKGIFTNIINKKINKNKRYILCGDISTLDVWFHFWKPNKLIDIKYIVKDCLDTNENKLYGIKVKQFEEINEIEFDGIIICSYRNELYIKKTLENLYKDKNIIDIYENVPKYIKDFGFCYNENIIYKYIQMIKLTINSSTIEELNRFKNYITNKKELIKKEYKQECSTVIWGAGIHTKSLLNNTNIIKDLNVKWIVDKNKDLCGKIINGIPVISFKKLKEIKFNTFFISSCAFREEIKNEIKENFITKSYIDIYDTGEEYKIINKEIFLFKINCENIKKREDFIGLIKVYLAIRDFYNAEKYIEKYIEEKYDKSELLCEFLNELRLLLDEIKHTICDFKEKNIHFTIIDSLDKYAMDNYMPYLSDYAKKNINFENAISPSTWTLESHMSMFKGKNLFEDNTFIRIPIENGNSRFIEELNNRGYKNYFNNGVRILNNIADGFIGDENDKKPISKMLWENICFRIMGGDNKKFIYSRFMEYHDSRILLSDKVARYIDLQLKYYNNFINKRDYVVVMADHGNSSFKEDLDRRSHVSFLIKTPNNHNYIIEKLVSTKNIGNILINTIDDNIDSIKEKTQDYVKIERTPIYNEISRRHFKRGNNEKFVQAFRIIRTLKEKLIIFEDGTEKFFLLEDEENNLINNSKYQDCINRLRKIHLKDGFPNFYVDSKIYK